jgi:predicted subunit of tRNA(5-methylaminomethyl-2-thiouridylate) methyltransferase
MDTPERQARAFAFITDGARELDRLEALRDDESRSIDDRFKDKYRAEGAQRVIDVEEAALRDAFPPVG